MRRRRGRGWPNSPSASASRAASWSIPGAWSSSCVRRCTSTRGPWCGALAAEHSGSVGQVAVFGDDIGDLPAFAAVGELGEDGHPVGAVRVAAVDDESPAAVADAADLTVAGALGAVDLLHAGWPPPPARDAADATGPTPRSEKAQARASAAAIWSAHQSAAVRPVTLARRAPARSARSAAPIDSAWCSASAVAATSKGFTPMAPRPARESSSHAPASR